MVVVVVVVVVGSGQVPFLRLRSSIAIFIEDLVCPEIQ